MVAIERKVDGMTHRRLSLQPLTSRNQQALLQLPFSIISASQYYRDAWWRNVLSHACAFLTPTQKEMLWLLKELRQKQNFQRYVPLICKQCLNA